MIKAVDDYQDLLRLSVATAGNDHRLGANEAPPAVVSIFLGDELNGVLEAIENDTPYAGTEKTQMKLGVNVLPKFNRDTRIATVLHPLHLPEISSSSVCWAHPTVLPAPISC